MVELFSVALNFNSATQIAALFFIIIFLFGVTIIIYLIVKCFCKLITSFTKVDISGKQYQQNLKLGFVDKGEYSPFYFYIHQSNKCFTMNTKIGLHLTKTKSYQYSVIIYYSLSNKELPHYFYSNALSIKNKED